MGYISWLAQNANQVGVNFRFSRVDPNYTTLNRGFMSPFSSPPIAASNNSALTSLRKQAIFDALVTDGDDSWLVFDSNIWRTVMAQRPTTYHDGLEIDHADKIFLTLQDDPSTQVMGRGGASTGDV